MAAYKESRRPSGLNELLPSPSADVTVRSASPSLLRISPPYDTKECQIAEVLGDGDGWAGGGGDEIERWGNEEVLAWLRESGFEQHQVSA